MFGNGLNLEELTEKALTTARRIKEEFDGSELKEQLLAKGQSAKESLTELYERGREQGSLDLSSLLGISSSVPPASEAPSSFFEASSTSEPEEGAIEGELLEDE